MFQRKEKPKNNKRRKLESTTEAGALVRLLFQPISVRENATPFTSASVCSLGVLRSLGLRLRGVHQFQTI